MSIIRRMRKQKCVYWAPSDASKDRYGTSKYFPPIEIDCRWDDVVEQFVNLEGDTELSKSLVYVDENIRVKIGGYMWLGRLADLPKHPTSSYEPSLIDDASEIQSIKVNPNLKNTERLVTVVL